jgi:hypothetical protein
MYRSTARTLFLMAVAAGIWLLLAAALFGVPGAEAQGEPNPNFAVRFLIDQVDGFGWPSDASVTLIIDDPATPEDTDYTATQPVTPGPPSDPDQTLLGFNLRGAFDIQPGHVVTLTNGAITKAHTVTDLAVTDVDPENDTVSGTAPADTEVGVRPCDPSGCYNAYATADASGNWTADLTGIYDIVPGSGGEAFQNDSDGDFTSVSWSVPQRVWLPLVLKGTGGQPD